MVKKGFPTPSSIKVSLKIFNLSRRVLLLQTTLVHSNTKKKLNPNWINAIDTHFHTTHTVQNRAVITLL